MHLKLGICGSRINEENLNGKNLGYEIDSILNEAEKIYNEIVLIDPKQIIHLFEPNENHPQIIYQSRDLSDLNTCIFRSITGVEESISLLARNLHYCSCDIIDPIERFTGAPTGKYFDSIKGFSRKIIPTTFFAFNLQSAHKILEIVGDKGLFPVILKPGKGKRGENVNLATSYHEGIILAKDHFDIESGSDSSLIIQKYIEIKDEYRGIVLQGKCLGLVKKIAAPGKVAHNAAQGGTFINVIDKEIEKFIEENASKKGLVGVDVARDVENKIHYIESNRSPQWKSFEEATNLNVAGKLIEFAYQRAKHPSDLF